MSRDRYFLSFIEHLNSVAALNAKKMEELLYEDPSSAIVKARLFAEEILNEVFKLEGITDPYVSTLYDKIVYLTREEILTSEIQSAFDSIRITGNKAAHIGNFNDITAAFKLHKVMYRIAVWFYEVYSKEELRIPLYEHPTPKQDIVNIEDVVKKQIMELLGSKSIVSDFSALETELKNNDQQVEVLQRNLPPGESYLLRELKRLQDSAKEAIENANTFSTFKKYMHVGRKIQFDLERILKKNKESNNGNLILLCGSVGDGKSHLLAYIKENHSELLQDYSIFNDATESFSPSKNAMETLEEILQDFSDEKLQKSDKKVILAINMGVLHNFITQDHYGYTYDKLNQFIQNSNLFTQSITTYYSEGNFGLISFGDYHSYELTKDGPKSSFYTQLLQKIFANNEENPFYFAYKEDISNGIRTMAHENYEFMQQAFVQEQIVNLVIQTLIKFKLVISARSFLNFIADIIIPENNTRTNILSEFERLELSVPNLLFQKKERSVLLKSIYELDPIHIRNSYIDEIIINLNTLSDWDVIVDRYVNSVKGKQWLLPFMNEESLSDATISRISQFIIRVAYLTDDKFAMKVEDQTYLSFMKTLFGFNFGDKSEITKCYGEVKDALFKWKGSPIKDYIYINRPSEMYSLAQKLNFRPLIDHLHFYKEEILESFKSTIFLAYTGGLGQERVYLEIDYPLYELLQKVRDGYCPNKKDEEDAIKFVDFTEKIMSFGEKKNELLIHFLGDSRFYKLKRDDFGSFVFEKEN